MFNKVSTLDVFQRFSKAFLPGIQQPLAQVLLFHNISHTTNCDNTIIKPLVNNCLVNSYQFLLLKLTINRKLPNTVQGNRSTRTVIGVGGNI